MLTLWWVRHGPTHRREMIGWTDAPADLSDRPRLARLAAYLPRTAVVISSDLDRARRTADAIQGPRARLPHEPGLREIHFGEWENRPFEEIARHQPDLTRLYLEAPGNAAPPGGESWNDLAARVSAAVSPLGDAHREVIVVAHFGPILTQIQRARGCTARDVLSQPVAPLSVTRLHWDGAAWEEELTNHQP